MIKSLKDYQEALPKLKIWADAYYNENNPIVTDEVYDKLYHQLLEFENRNPHLIDPTSVTQKVGAGVKKGFKKEKHLSRMWSMEDVFDTSGLNRWIERLEKHHKGTLQFYIEPKFDGASLNLIYQDGTLQRAVTRGDGEIGEDVTENAKVIKSIPQNIDYKEKIEIRGEVLMRFSQFEKINMERIREGLAPFANPRNCSAGTLRLLDSSITAKRELIFQPWGVGVNSLKFSFLSDMMGFIYSLGFNEPLFKRVAKSRDEIESSYKELLKLRAGLDVMLDGMVVKADELSVQEELGFTLKYPKYMVAYKFPAVEKETEIENIIYQVGRTGLLTPVALLKPIELEGVTVSRATLNNFDYIKRMDIQIGDTITIIRSGDVIPKVVRVKERKRRGERKGLERPELCPICNEELLIEDILIKCQNLSCPARVISSIVHFASKGCMNIHGVGKKVVESFYEVGVVRSVEDLYSLSEEKLLEIEGFREKRVKSILSSVEASKGKECWRFLKALGIEHIGEVASKKVCQEFGVDFLSVDRERLSEVEGFGEKSIDSFLEFMRVNRGRVLKLLDIIKPKEDKKSIDILEKESVMESSIFNGKRVVLTGTMSRHRADIEEILEGLGAKIVSSISKKVDYLIYGDNFGNKYQKAISLGVKSVSEEWMWSVIEKKD
jgi:DNA ligase (NAD+)